MARRLALILVALFLGLPLAALSPAEIAAAADGLSFRNTTTYTLDADAGVVHVVADISLTNTIPDTLEGSSINRRFFTGFSLPVPVGATNQMAITANGGPLGLTSRLIDGNGDFFVLDIDLADNLFYQQTAQVTVTYDITGLPPRSVNPSRVNAAYAAFDAFGIGDDGKVTVRVVVPPGFRIDTFGDDAVISQENGNTVYTATNIPNPNEFDIFVSARNDGGLVESSVSTPSGDQFNLRAWPGDTEWQAFVTTQIEQGVPVLGELVGQPWPIDKTVEVREAYTPYLYGYAGWFSASKNELEIGEDLDQEVVLHELSHAWFNDNWFADRWLSEGFAQVYSNKAVGELGGEPLAPETIVATDPGKVTLNDWGDPNFAGGADDVETYGYNASFFVVQQIVAAVGDDKMREVLAAVADRTIAYRGDAEPEQYDGVTDWRHFLDLIDEVGVANDADTLFDQYVVTDSQRELLAGRDDARSAYQRLVDEGATWAPPLVVRQRMSSWSFGSAQDAIDESRAVLALRSELDGKTTVLGSSYPAALEAAYEGAEANLDDAKDAVQQQIDSADRLLAAVAANDESDGLFGKLGLIDTNLPALLDEARAALAVGDHQLARATAQQVLDTVEQAPGVGKERSLWAGGGVVLSMLLLTLLIVVMRRRQRQRRSAQDAVASADETLAVDDGSDDDGSDAATVQLPTPPRPPSG